MRSLAACAHAHYMEGITSTERLEVLNGWLLSDVVGGHYTNATKQTQTVELFRLIIVLKVSLHVSY